MTAIVPSNWDSVSTLLLEGTYFLHSFLHHAWRVVSVFNVEVVTGDKWVKKSLSSSYKDVNYFTALSLNGLFTALNIYDADLIITYAG